MLFITFTIIFSGFSTRVLTIFVVSLAGSFVWLCFYHRKRIYINLVFKDSMKLSEVKKVVAECNNRFSDKEMSIDSQADIYLE